ncbi:hypothetical protein KC320_g46 [Hortaea werneckii]|nr:hypothetical protein KC320_g46 [Hortaea werneckii]
MDQRLRRPSRSRFQLMEQQSPRERRSVAIAAVDETFLRIDASDDKELTTATAGGLPSVLRVRDHRRDGKGGAPKCFHGCVDHGVDLITRILFYQPGYTSYWDFDESEPKQLPIYFQKRKRLACYQNHPSSFNLAVTAAAATAHLNHHTVPAAVASVLLGRTDGPARPSLDDVGCSACCCCICISY